MVWGTWFDVLRKRSRGKERLNVFGVLVKQNGKHDGRNSSEAECKIRRMDTAQTRDNSAR